MLDFSKDLGAIVADFLNSPIAESEADDQSASNSANAIKLKHSSLKAKKALGKKLVKAVQAPLEDAVRKECQLLKHPSEIEIERLHAILDETLLARPGSLMTNGDQVSANKHAPALNGTELINGQSSGKVLQNSREGLADSNDADGSNQPRLALRASGRTRRSNTSNEDRPVINGHSNSLENVVEDQNLHISPKQKEDDRSFAAHDGGIPWYMQSFRPEGTTIEEEQWSGRDLVRAMSEDLSDST